MRTVEARGMGRPEVASLRESEPRIAARARGAHLTAQAPIGVTREGRQDGPSQGPDTDAVPPAVSRAAGVNKNAGAQFAAAARMSHQEIADEQHSF